MKNKIIINGAWMDAVKFMDNESTGVLFKILLNYAAGKKLDYEIPDFDLQEQAFTAFTFLKFAIEAEGKPL